MYTTIELVGILIVKNYNAFSIQTPSICDSVRIIYFRWRQQSPRKDLKTIETIVSNFKALIMQEDAGFVGLFGRIAFEGHRQHKMKTEDN